MLPKDVNLHFLILIYRYEITLGIQRLKTTIFSPCLEDDLTEHSILCPKGHIQGKSHILKNLNIQIVA